MGAKAQVDFGFGGIRGGIKDLDDLRGALGGVDGSAKKLGATYKGLKNLWEDPAGAKGGWSNAQRTGAGIAKMTAEALASQASAAASAVTAPGKTTYDQALSRFRDYREDVQRMATASGEGFGSVDKRILDTSKRLGVLPGQVQAYGESIRNVTGGTMADALQGMDAAREQSLKTGRGVEDLIGPIIKLRQNFGIKSTQEVNNFFGNLDNQAKNAKISAEVARTAWEASSATLTRVTSMSAQAQSAFTTQIVGNTMAAGGNAEMGGENAAELSSFMRNKAYLLEKVLRKRGMLGKDEHILDKTGRLTEKGFAQGLVASKEVMGNFYGKKDPLASGMKAELSGEMSTGAYMQLNSFDYKKWQTEKDAKDKAAGMSASSSYLASDAGKRAAAEAQKDRRDLGLGSTMIGAQDTAVSMGGGAAGIAMAAAGGIFSQATGIFAGAVDRWIGGLGRAGIGAATGTVSASAAGAATGSTAGVAARAAATRAGLGAIATGAGLIVGLGAALPATGDDNGYSQMSPEELAKRDESGNARQAKYLRQLAADQHKGGLSGWWARNQPGSHDANWNIREAARLEAAAAPAQASQTAAGTPDGSKEPAWTPGLGGLQTGGSQPSGPVPVSMELGGWGQEMEAAFSKALKSATVRTQSIEPPAAPAGQSS